MFVLSSKTEVGSAGEQPIRDNCLINQLSTKKRIGSWIYYVKDIEFVYPLTANHLNKSITLYINIILPKSDNLFNQVVLISFQFALL